MINKHLESEDLVLEIKELINGVETFKDEINIYCDLMKQMFLLNSTNN